MDAALIDPRLNGSAVEGVRSGQEDEQIKDVPDEEDEDEEGESLGGADKDAEDSSEEDDDEDSEEERRVRKDFIAEDDDEDGERKHKRRKHRHRKHHRRHRHKHRHGDGEGSEDDARGLGDLDEDDLDLVAENTGIARARPEKRRLRRAGSVASDDLDAEGRDGVGAIWADDDDDDDDDDQDEGPSGRRYEDGLDDFIEEDEADEADDRAARSRKSKGKAPARAGAVGSRLKQAGKVMGALAPAISGISKDAWEEVMETFGNGEDYDWAMELDGEDDEGIDVDGEGALGEGGKSAAVRLRDIYEPSELKERMLTDADEAIRNLDVPERTQLAALGLGAFPSTSTAAAAPEPLLSDGDIADATTWMERRISPRCLDQFVLKVGGFPPAYANEFRVALSTVIRFFALDFLEVPFVWAHRRDYVTFQDKQAQYESDRRLIHLLLRDEVWKVQTLTFKYRALLERKRGLERLAKKVSLPPESRAYFDDCFRQIESVDEVHDLMQWLRTHHRTAVAAAQADWREEADDLAAGGLGPDAEAELGLPQSGAPKEAKLKKATRETKFERALASPIRDLAKAISSTSIQDFVASLAAGHGQQFPDDPEVMPDEVADQYVDVGTEWDDATKALDAAKLILSTQIGKDPVLKKYVRDQFKLSGMVSVNPTEKGVTKIDESHPFYTFKYLENKPFEALAHSPQFLQIISAEQDLLVTVSIHLDPKAEDKLRRDMAECFKSDGTSELAAAWNKVRQDVLDHAVDHVILPEAARWARNFLREESETTLAQRCGDILEDRIEVAPFRPRNLIEGEIPSVVAISNGAGDFRRDSTFMAYLDEQGRFRDHMVFSDLRDDMTRRGVLDFLGKRKPNVIVVGGFTAATYRLLNDIKPIASLLADSARAEAAQPGGAGEDPAEYPVITVRDDTARIYQLSKRAEQEFPSLTPIAKYCVALARYVQSPLNEYAALGKELVAVSYSPDQTLLPADILQAALDRALVNVVNLVGVDVNRAVHDSYYQHLLPYVCGLGPRKASKLVKAINAVDGTLRTREELVTLDIVTAKVFYNCASFLRILQDDAQADLSTRETEPDVLDDTRIHPEDYHIARKMAADALELDEEDLTDQHPSQVVADLMDQGARKLDELSLDDFAEELERLLHAKKRFTLYQIREELQHPHREKRPPFHPLSSDEFFNMVTGESEATLSRALVIPTKIVRHRERDIIVRLDSGLEGTISKEFMVDSGQPDMSKFPVGATIPAVVMEIHKDRFSVELNAQPATVAANAAFRMHVQPDRFFNHHLAVQEKDAAESRRKKGSTRAKRVIKHPNFHNFNAGQAEQFLSSQPRGECVIRPSSRGPDHLAVTWKVDEDVYQHIDVLELDKPTDFALGRSLRIGGKYNYSDLDELIFSHVRGMARKVEEMMLHEKYKGSKEELASFLSTSILANPEMAVYGFAIDKDNPGRFHLGFRTKNMPTMSVLVVKVLPTSFQLGETDLPDMLSLCNAFKMQHINRNLALAANSGARSVHGSRTPYGAPAGGRTPQLNYGGATPRGAYGQMPGYGQSPAYPPQAPQQVPAYAAGAPYLAPQGPAPWAQQPAPPQNMPRAPAYGYR